MAKSLISSGSFEVEIQNYDQLKQNLAEFVDCACLRLRRQQALANGIWTELHSNRFNPNRPRYDNARFVSLDQPSDNTADFMNAMKRGLDAIYRPDCWYKRAGVTLVGLEAANSGQQNWLVDRRRIERGHALMQTFDEINRKHGRKTIFLPPRRPRPNHTSKGNSKAPILPPLGTNCPKPPEIKPAVHPWYKRTNPDSTVLPASFQSAHTSPGCRTAPRPKRFLPISSSPEWQPRIYRSSAKLPANALFLQSCAR